MSTKPAPAPYRYGIILSGLNCAPGYPYTPAHVIMAKSLDHARRLIRSASYGQNYGDTLTGSGLMLLNTPDFGYPGDGAVLYRVTSHEGYKYTETSGERARLCYSHMSHEPAYLMTFGPRGGITTHKL